MNTLKRIITIFLAFAMVICFIPSMGVQTAYAETDVITRVDIETGADLPETIIAGYPVDQPTFTVTNVESELGTVKPSDMVFETGEYYGWCQSCIYGGDIDWIKYAEDGIQDLFFTSGESRMMVDIFANPDKVSALFTEDTKVYLNGQLMSFYKLYANDEDYVGYLSYFAKNKEITYVEINGLTLPTAGASPTTAGVTSNSETAGFTIAEMGWVDNYGHYFDDDYVFEPGKTYKLYIRLWPEDGFEFPRDVKKDVNLTVNGQSYVSQDTYEAGTACIWGDYQAISIAVYYKVPGAPCQITYNAGGGSGTMESEIVEENNYLTLPECKFDPPAGKEFEKWQIGTEYYLPGDKVMISAATTVTAVWTNVETFTLIYEMNGHGPEISSVSGIPRNSLLADYIPTVEQDGDYLFGGWYKDADFLQPVDAESDRIAGDMTIYAYWYREIHQVTFDGLKVPIGGEAPTTAGITMNDEVAGYTIAQIRWVDDYGHDFEDGFVYRAGETYRIFISLYPATGFVFPRNVKQDVKLTVNGIEYVSQDSYQAGTACLWGEPENLNISIYYKALSKITVPSGKTLTYNGKTQTGVESGIGYSVSGTNSATKAGKYKATVTPLDGYCWQDGTTEDKIVSWTIEAKEITPTVTLSKASFTYNGKAQKPTVTVKDGSTVLAASQYTVAYSPTACKNVGKVNVKVTLKGNYKGTKTVSYKINPKGRSIKSVTAASKAITVNWVKQAEKMSTSYISGYQIYVATDSAFTKNVKKVYAEKYSTVSKKITGLKGNTKYYVKMRTYKTVAGVKYYSPWCTVKTVTTKA